MKRLLALSLASAILITSSVFGVISAFAEEVLPESSEYDNSLILVSPESEDEEELVDVEIPVLADGEVPEIMPYTDEEKISILPVPAPVAPDFVPVEISPEETERLLKIVKSKVNIPAELTKFNADFRSNGQETIYIFRWEKEQDKSGSYAYANVQVNANGQIINYSKYDSSQKQYSNKVQLPKFNKEECLEIAKEFMSKVLTPEEFESYDFNTNSSFDSYTPAYYFNFPKTVNGVKILNYAANVTVDCGLGEVNNYYNYFYEFSDKLTFPSKDGVISLEEAKAKFIENNGLELIYNAEYKDNKLSTYLAYAPSLSSIDAIDGKFSQNESGYSMGGGYYSRDSIAQNSMPYEMMLTPEETEKIEELKDVVTVQEAEQYIRNIPIIRLDDTYALVSNNYYWQGNWGNRSYVLSLEFRKVDGEEENSSSWYTSVTINAKTKDIMSVNSYNYGIMPVSAYARNTLGNNLEQAEETVQAFLDSYKPGYSLKLKDSNNNGDPQNTWLLYERDVNGIRFPSNSLQFNISNDGKISYFYQNWNDNLDFVSPDNIISKEEALEKYLSAIELELFYDVQFKNQASLYEKYPAASTGYEVKLVYSSDKNIRYTNIDAVDGKFINTYDRTPYISFDELQYSDIDGHKNEEIIDILSKLQVTIWTDSQLQPDKEITQKEFISLIQQAMRSYYVPYYDLEGAYQSWISSGIMKEEEKDPDALVTREEAAKLFVIALNYREVAEIEDAYNCQFNDKDEISENLIGYTVIADGLDIIKSVDGNFNPTATVSRADAFEMIYNYLIR